MSRPYEVLARGSWSAERVTARLVPAPRPTTCDLEAHIASTWEAARSRAGKEGRQLFNGSLFGLESFTTKLEDGRSLLSLRVRRVEYREFVGTNLTLGAGAPADTRRCFADPVGTSAVVKTSDDRLVLGRRSDRVAYHAGYVHTFGGMLEADDERPDGHVAVAGSIERELLEELLLEQSLLEVLRCFALVRDRSIVQPELLFLARIRLTEAELRARWQEAPSRDEHADLVSVRWRPGALAGFARTAAPIAAVAVAALELLDGAMSQEGPG